MANNDEASGSTSYNSVQLSTGHSSASQRKRKQSMLHFLYLRLEKDYFHLSLNSPQTNRIKILT
jgi:hypothetical protein